MDNIYMVEDIIDYQELLQANAPYINNTDNITDSVS